MTQVTTRPVQTRDLPQVLEMVHALAAHHGDISTLDMETLTRDVTEPMPWVRVLVAEMDVGLIGYAALCPLMQLQFGKRGMDLHHLLVAHAVRGQGVGTALIKASETQAKKLHCDFLTVGTHPDNDAAQEVYLSAGFERLPLPGPRFRKFL